MQKVLQAMVFSFCLLCSNNSFAFVSAPTQIMNVVNITVFASNGETVLEYELTPTEASTFLDLGEKQLLLYFNNVANKDFADFVISGDSVDGRSLFLLSLGETEKRDFCGFSFVVSFVQKEVSAPSFVVW